MNALIISLMLMVTVAYATDLQVQLMEIAAAEAKIANIGANKAHMLYGINNPILIINRWNGLEHHPALTEDQIEQIKQLEAQKQSILNKVVK
jgi:hypothetical protein